MALGAGAGKAQEAAGRDVDTVVIGELARRVDEDRERREKLLVVHVGQKVRRELRFDEEVIGHVAVERLDDPVAVVVELRRVPDKHVVGVARDVEPIASPAFAVVR